MELLQKLADHYTASIVVWLLLYVQIAEPGYMQYSAAGAKHNSMRITKHNCKVCDHSNIRKGSA